MPEHRTSQLAAVAAIAVGGLALAGWRFDARLLASWVPDHPAMPANTALAVVLGGVALLLLAPEAPPTFRRRTGSLLAATVVLVGAAGLAGHLFENDLGLDRALEPLLPAMAREPLAGRPLPVAAFLLTLTGAALGGLSARRPATRRAARALAVLAVFVAVLAVTAHVYGAALIYEPTGRFTGIALPASAASFLLASGVLLARPREGLMSIVAADASGATMARRLAPLAIAAPPLIGLLVQLAGRAGFEDLPTAFAILAVSAVAIGVATMLVIARPLNARDLALRKAHTQEHVLRRQLETVHETWAAASRSLAEMPRSDLNAVLQAILLQAQAATGAELAALGIGTDPDRPFDPWIQSGIPPDVAAALGHAPRPVGTLGAVVFGGRTIRADDVEKHPEFRGYPPGHPVVRSFLGVPIRYDDHNVGNLYLGNKRDGVAFSDDDQRFVEMVAARVSATLEAARLYQTEIHSRRWFQTVLDRMPEAILFADPRGDVVWCNGAALALSCAGPDASPGEGRTIRFDVRDPGGAPVAWASLPIADAIRSRLTAMGLELELRNRSGQRHIVLASTTPIHGWERFPHEAAAVVVLQDVTTLRELQRLREEWAAVIAHDLRQPIATLATATEALTAADDAETRAAVVPRLRRSVARLARMVDDLLEMSRVEARQLKIVRATVDVPALLAGIVERAQDALAGHPVAVRTRGAFRPASLDADRIEQVVGNLLSNAARYGEPGTEIALDVEGREADFEVAVRNRGPGIGPAELTRLFTRFYRAPAAEARPAKGLGLGLYISKGIVEAHGGRIWAESVPGETTTFRFVIPWGP